MKKLFALIALGSASVVSADGYYDQSSKISDSSMQSQKKHPHDFAPDEEDRQLNAKIRDKLSKDAYLKSNETLVIRTANGIVVIKGTVDRKEDIQRLHDLVKEIEGVKSIDNQVTIK